MDIKKTNKQTLNPHTSSFLKFTHVLLWRQLSSILRTICTLMTLTEIIAWDTVDENPQAGLRNKKRGSYTPRIDVHSGQWFHSWPEASFLTGSSAITWFTPEIAHPMPEQFVIMGEYWYEKQAKLHSVLRNLEHTLIKKRNNCDSS